MSASCCRMTRCECHEAPFSEVLDYAERTGIEDFDRLCALVGCGQTCTACHGDLKEYLEENLATAGVAA
ncbi:MAG: hypothetical protein GHCLOJNM_01679 [bacterium]|nr:hypothetical protein [bacterium]